ncbi:DUF421 domain-containing protein [Paenibacillus wynnii]|uniref:YetF domain-containing protein n=1 Tax=Paenibacillus wynnii TaxID=268407 RepID=UPI002791E6EE|nr:DUF421 domain-containing protein [Paenibacillus wynnii]MDQ0192727.1 uncharacterized membrane protein YcaP (DUF421 family) [Paenibacillus wynnii]
MFKHITTHIFLTMLMYFFIFLSMRIMGKREIGKLSVFDLTISIMIAEIAVFVIEDIQRPIYDGVVPMATLVFIQVLIARLSLKSRSLRLFVDGKPSVIISDGKLHRKEMRKQRYNMDDLLLQLRGHNINSPADVEFAILETSGQLTVIEKYRSESSDSKDKSDSGDNNGSENNAGEGVIKPLHKQIRYEGLPVPLIMDGKVQLANLEILGKDRFWLRSQIREKGVRDFRDVFLCSIDHKGRVYVDSIHSD